MYSIVIHVSDHSQALKKVICTDSAAVAVLHYLNMRRHSNHVQGEFVGLSLHST